MSGTEHEFDPSRARVSDADRDRVAEFLREAAAVGRLDHEELEERLEATFSAKVYADLTPLVIDLPYAAGEVLPVQAAPPAAVRIVAPGSTGQPAYGSSMAVMSGFERKGAWEVPARHTAFVLMGGGDIDLREALFTSQEVTIYANAVMGGIDVIVNPWTRISVEGVGLMGAFEEGKHKAAPEIGPHSPHVRVRGLALMGAVTVVRKPMPGEKRRRLLPRRSS